MRVEFISGKGGVGKSAVAAALARLHRRRGERVLAIAMVPGGGLASHLGLPVLSMTPVAGDDGVHAMEIRRVEALEEYVRLYSPIPLLSQLGRAINAFDSLATAAPGVRELITMGKILYTARDWDRVIVDAVPTGQIGSFLRAPEVIRELIPSGRVNEQAESLESTLREDCDVGFVTIGEELPVTETLEAMEELSTLPAPLGPVIVNRALAPVSFPIPREAGPLGDAARLQDSLSAGQERWRGELPQGPVLPFLFGATDPRLVAEFLCATLEEWS